MSIFGREPPTPVLTPCIGICEVGTEDRCAGCLRTLDEIARWSSMDDAERARIMREVLPQRAGSHPDTRG